MDFKNGVIYLDKSENFTSFHLTPVIVVSIIRKLKLNIAPGDERSVATNADVCCIARTKIIVTTRYRINKLHNFGMAMHSYYLMIAKEGQKFLYWYSASSLCIVVIFISIVVYILQEIFAGRREGVN